MIFRHASFHLHECGVFPFCAEVSIPNHSGVGGVLDEGERPLPGNRDNNTEGFEGFPVILKDSDDQ